MTDRARPVEIRVEVDPDLDAMAPESPAQRSEGSSSGRRRWWWAGAIALVLVGGLAVSEAVESARDARRDARLEAIDGVVPDLTTPPVVAWEAPPSHVLGTVPDGLVASVPVRVSTSVAVFDTNDGAVRWARGMGRGGPDWCSGVVSEGVLCWLVTESTGWRRGAVVVLDPLTGAQIGRLDDVVTVAGAVGVVGGLVVVRDIEAGTELASVDPATGEVFWDLLLPPRYAGSAVEVSVVAVGDLVALLGPRTYVLDPATGEVLLDVAGRWGVVPVPEGFARRTAAHVWQVYDLAGTPRALVPGKPVEPSVSDGSEPRVLMVTDGDAYRAVDRDTGEVIWSLPDDRGTLSVRREGVVVHVADDRVEAIDLVTGDRRWVWRSEDLVPSSGVLCDGHRVMVVAHPGGDWVGHAIDLDTGERRWTAPLPRPAAAIEFVFPGLTPRIEAMAGQAFTVGPQSEVVWWARPGTS